MGHSFATEELTFKRRFFLGLVSLIVGTAIWIPFLHLLFLPGERDFRAEDGISPTARQLAQRHLSLWTAEPGSQADLEVMRLTDFKDKKNLILYFYPKDNTPGCTKEACDIRDMHDDISDVGIRVIGISPQGEDSHTRFKAKHRLPFTLLADPDKSAVKDYGVDGPLGFGVRRATFFIREDGTIDDVVVADLLVGKHGDFIRQAVASRLS